MILDYWPLDLRLVYEWTIARGGSSTARIVLIRLTSGTVSGLGESAPIMRYGETPETVADFLKKCDAKKLSFDDVEASMKYLDTVAPENFAAKTAVNIALLDGAAQRAGKPIYDFIGLGFTEKKHLTSFSIGIDKPEIIRKKVLEAECYPVLKLKLGAPNDREILGALREAAPKKTVRVDANEGWKTKEEALRNIEWLATDSNIEFVEQPMPSTTPENDLRWLKARSPLPLYADESYHQADDVPHCAECFHGVNVKLVKTAGISGGFKALRAARKAGLKTMIGCMIETSILISAAAHLAELTDHLDIDGNILINNDPYLGATAVNGMVSFANAPEKTGLRVSKRNGA